ncbi:NahK/ErcS family hybrid sensor histidine kinase/response regulator [Aliiglaciecola sp. 3_MG-2023]|uniref:NahK/ErcS family hybrid sensor histidine kinase/response regulator n=1 Tax=Aliiglaciecola sp. 3_MG-2023 TaxID=3062644 RepID=UPI0026E345EA|nr:NahK/ErcS family hybrid sensor histidine kinase/response regulator [Aliiglaciecola sp. 3_MG-2023]MDO6694591.1 NahK/ErcS family hybrid sensor histidine kinase/response regulator [Aliiglaciecola sp. 3_MG-2023]
MTRTNLASSKNSDLTGKVDHHRNELEQLRYENQKLSKINNVLMRRVEMGWGNHSDAYQSFEDAALLADKVKERTQKLQQTLHRLEESNQKLEQARLDAERNRQASDQARQRLNDAIESISDSFALFDADRKMVMVNSRCGQFWRKHNINFEIGKTTFQEITAASLPYVDMQAKAQKTVGMYPDPITHTIFKLKDGTWIQMSERKTSEGDLVVIYTDITNIKQSEELRYEKAMAEQAQVLKSTLENMSQGIALVNAKGNIETWNKRFLQLAGIQKSKITRGDNYLELLQGSELDESLSESELPSMLLSQGDFEAEKTLQSGKVILIKRHLITSGGYLNSYTDITERSLNQQALQESEQRIRLITDAMPALISYVNKDMCYEFVNREFEKWFHRSRSEIISHHLNEVLGEEEFNKLYIYIERAMQGQSVNFELEHRHDGGNPRISNKTFIPHFDQDRNVIGFFTLEQDVTEQRRTAKALRHAYDYMEQRVNQRTQKISEINLQLRQEIEDRQLAEKSLIAAKSEADRANESKSKFLAATSHDLLQPMNSSRLFVAALNELSLSDDAQKLLSSLSYSLENLESLISALVDISKLEAGLIEPVLEDFSVNDLLNNLASEFTKQTESKNLRFRFSGSTSVVRSDPYLLARILRNLLSNAVRYTNEGSILLGVRRRKSALEIQVCDTGIGIPDDKLVEIFHEFNRIDGKKRRHDQGLGLGLAIVEKLAGVMNHRISVTSTEGQGSKFSIFIPYGSKTAQDLSVNQVTARDRFNSHLDAANILIIDNDMEICSGMETLLQGWGCEVTSVQTLAQLQDHNWLRALAPELIIADFHLDNGETGFDALKITEHVLGKSVPVIMITANYTNELRQQVREKGYSLLNKPVKPHKMKLAISNLLSNKQSS